MSFGFSVGDFVAIIQTATRIRRQFIDAPEQFREITSEVKRLSSVLRDIEDILDEGHLTIDQGTRLDEISRSYCDDFKQLEDKLKKFLQLDTKGAGLTGRSRNVWRKLQWDQKEIEQFRQKITLSIGSYNAFLAQITWKSSTEIKQVVDRISETQEDQKAKQEREEILEWLAPSDFALQQSDFFNRHQEGTGQWLLKSTIFQEWQGEKGRTLFCKGIPGAGKTIMTSIIVDHLHNEFCNDPTIAVAYFYNNFREEEKPPTKLLLCLLRQLAQQRGGSVP